MQHEFNLARRYTGRDIFEAPDFALSTSRCILQAPIAPHDHDFFEVAFIAGGDGRHLSAGEEKTASCGDGWLLFPGAWHAYLETRNLDVRNCCFAQSLLKRELSSLSHSLQANALFWYQNLATLPRAPLSFSVPANDFSGFVGAWESIESSLTPPAKIAATILFLERVASYFPLKREVNPPHRAIWSATKLLETDLRRDWTLNELAASVKLAPNYFLRLFKEATGLAPIAYLARLRADSAARLLLQTSLPIGEIASRVGWDDPNYFARRFRAAYGFSASQYRAKMRGELRREQG